MSKRSAYIGKFTTLVTALAILLGLAPFQMKTAKALTEYSVIAGVPFRIDLTVFYGSSYALGVGNRIGFVEPSNGSDYGDITLASTGAEISYGPMAYQYDSDHAVYYFLGRYEGTYGSMFVMNTDNFQQVWFNVVDLSPEATTNAASDITSSGAVLHGLANANDYDTVVGFEYGPTSSYGTSVNASARNISGLISVTESATLTALPPNTTYHYRLVATNMYGTKCGADKTFTTSAEAPVVTAGTASNITAAEAKLNGTVDARNASTTVTFEYGTTTGYGTSIPAQQSLVTGLGGNTVNAAILGLLPNTTYHYRVSGLNIAGTSTSGDSSFTTSKSAPTAVTDAANGVTITGAGLHGTVNAMNDAAAVSFEYGLTTAYGQSVTAEPGSAAGMSDTPVGASLTGLAPNKLYHYRVTATNSAGTTPGEDKTFTTLLKDAVSLTADTSDNSVDYPLEITFSANPDFESSIAAVYYGGDSLTPGTDYSVSSGKITLNPAGGNLALRTAGTAEVTVEATDYYSSSVSQTILAGEVSQIEVTGQPVPGAYSGDAFSAQPAVTLLDQYGNVCSSGVSSALDVTASAEAGTGTWTIGGTVTAAVSSGMASFTDLTCTILTPGTGKINFSAGGVTAASDAFDIPFKPSVTLTADDTDNSVDHLIEITFPADSDFESKITGVSYGGASLTAGTDYEISSGKITLTPAGGNLALRTAGTAVVTVEAESYNSSSVSQTIMAGEVHELQVIPQPVPGTFSGDAFATQPAVKLLDRYGNVCSNGVSSSLDVTASAGAGTGTWSIGGTAAKTAASGVAVFTDLTSTLLTPGTGLINFASGGMNASSDAFTIPLKHSAVLTADAADNSVDNPIEITFPADSEFEGGITSVSYGGVSLSAGMDYVVSSGKITLTPTGGNTALRTAGNGNVVITATGYNDSAILQTIMAGAVCQLQVIAQPVPGAFSGDAFATQPSVKLLDQYGNVCSSGVSSALNVTASAAAGTGTWIMGGTAAKTVSSGMAVFTDLTCTLQTPGTGRISFAAGGATVSSEAFSIPLKHAVTLAADVTDNSADNPIEITYSANADFEGKITGISYSGATLSAGADYNTSSGKITLTPAGGNTALQTAGSGNVVITATGYNDSTIHQTIMAGAAAGLQVTTQPVPSSFSGDAFAAQPAVKLLDQYGNTCSNGVSASLDVTASAAAGSGSWILGGTAAKTASSGIAAFSDLTCTLQTPGTGQISFAAGGVSVLSDEFGIPLKHSVTLTADTTDNSVDHPMEITFPTDSEYEGKITAISYGGASLSAGTDYEVSSGKITLMPEGANTALQTAGTADVVVTAAGYRDSIASQTITAGTVTSIEVYVQPEPGENSGDAFSVQPVVKLRDQYGNLCMDGLSSAAEVTASAVSGTGEWDIGGTVKKAAVNGAVSFDNLTLTQVMPGTGKIGFASGSAMGNSSEFNLPLKNAVVLTADTTDNDVDNPLVITFESNADFAGKITEVAYGGTVLAEGTDYTVSTGKITLIPAGGNSVLQKPNTMVVAVAAAGYRSTSVSQTITAGAVSSLEISVQPVPGLTSGDIFTVQPQVTLKDQYGNVCLDGPSAAADVTASAVSGSGEWDIGGTVKMAAVDGVVSFDNLTLTQVMPGTGKIGFTSGPAGESSTEFVLPLKNAVTLTADTENNSVDSSLAITFASNADFESKITTVKYGSAVLAEGTDYTVSTGKIILKPAGGNSELQKPNTMVVTVAAAGYRSTSVSQTITAGAVSSLEISAQPVPGLTSGDIFTVQPQVILKDQYGNICMDGPSAAADVTASAVSGTGEWDIGGTVKMAAMDGTVSFDNLTLTQVMPGTGKIGFTSGPARESSTEFVLPLKNAVTLTADTVNNSVDNPLAITFASNADFERKITTVKYGSAVLAEGTDYAVSTGKIILKPAGGNSVLQTPSDKVLIVAATGYRDTSVSQAITAGAVSSFTISIQPVPGLTSGDIFAVQPKVTLKDQYGNICLSGPSMSADVTASAVSGSGEWDIGGTVKKAAVDGAVSFDNLTLTQVMPGTGKMGFTSGAARENSAEFELPPKSAVVLTADTTNNNVDNTLEITFESNADFAGKITEVSYGGAVLAEGTDYTVSNEKITLKPAGGNSVLQKPNTTVVTVSAAGYRNTSVSQTITAGAADRMDVTVQPVPGQTSGDIFTVQPQAILKDRYGNICKNGPSAAADVTASAVPGTGKWEIGGTVKKAAANGLAVFDDLTLTQLMPGTGKMGFTYGEVKASSAEFELPLKKEVLLSADTENNNVDNALDITFESNADFAGKITEVAYGGTVLAKGTDYTVSDEKITLKPAGGNSVLQKPNTMVLTVAAAGYRGTSVSQTITAGSVSSLEITVQPVPGKESGNAFSVQPVIILKDRYGNVCKNGPSSSSPVTASAANDTGTWTIGGTVIREAVGGTASFTDLTIAVKKPGKGKIAFNCGTVAASSNAFVIPERDSSISPFAFSFDKYPQGSNYKDILVTMTLNGNTLKAITNGGSTLTAGTDYTVADNTVAIKREYLEKQLSGAIPLTFDFSLGVDSVLTVTVYDSTPVRTDVIVNGGSLDAGTVSTAEENGRTVTTVTVDDEGIQEILNTQESNQLVVIPVTTGADVSKVEISGQLSNSLQAAQATLQVQTATSTYTLPPDSLDLEAAALMLGENVPIEEIRLNITISEPPAETVQVVENAAEAGNFAIMVPAVEFKVECSYGEQSVEVSNFNAYVERTIAIPEGTDPGRITTAIVVRPDGSTYHVPTKIIVIDGKYYAQINSLTNSTYTLIWHPVAYEDVNGHWAQEAINDMGSRMIATGVDKKNYAPDANITRADFVADVVRALGLSFEDSNSIPGADQDSNRYAGYVKAAEDYGILMAEDASAFQAEGPVSREEAMVLIARAMTVARMETVISPEDRNTLLSACTDGSAVSETAKDSAAACLKAEVTFDLADGKLLPQQPVTRAEAAVILRLLLQKAGLI